MSNIEKNKLKRFKYKGYVGKVCYHEESQVYHGRLQNVGADIITFSGPTIEEAEADFKAAVDDYINWNKEV